MSKNQSTTLAQKDLMGMLTRKVADVRPEWTIRSSLKTPQAKRIGQLWGTESGETFTGTFEAEFTFCDITSGNHVLPSVVFQREDGVYAFMTLDEFRNLMVEVPFVFHNGKISGVFEVVEYEGSEQYIRLVR